MTLARKLMMAHAGAGGALDVAELFSTDLYWGNSSTQTIVNGLDLSGEGGLVWLKSRSVAQGHIFIDTQRGLDKFLRSEGENAEATSSSIITAVSSSGFTLGTGINLSGETYAAWSFRRAPRFFDVVTYTGNGVDGRTISHNLGVTPGMIIIKCRSNSPTNWQVYHRANTSAPETDALYLNFTDATTDDNSFWWDTLPSATHFTVGANGDNNGNGRTYVAYLFAHDPDPTGIIQCGSYTGNGLSSGGPSVTLGWEPQFILLKRAGGVSNWAIFDNARATVSADPFLAPNLSNSEFFTTTDAIDYTSTGFRYKLGGDFNASSEDIIYIAIRAEGA